MMTIKQKQQIAQEIIKSLKEHKLTLGEANQIASTVASTIRQKVINVGKKVSIWQ